VAVCRFCFLMFTCIKTNHDRWGPMGIVRRRTDTWPEPIDDSDTSSSLNSSDAS
jgi:hypothetical protein